MSAHTQWHNHLHPPQIRWHGQLRFLNLPIASSRRRRAYDGYNLDQPIIAQFYIRRTGLKYDGFDPWLGLKYVFNFIKLRSILQKAVRCSIP